MERHRSCCRMRRRTSTVNSVVSSPMSGPNSSLDATRRVVSRSSTIRRDSAAPQAILLAVPPVVGEPWTVGNLNRVLLETLDMLRIRAVDPTALGDVDALFAGDLPRVQCER